MSLKDTAEYNPFVVDYWNDGKGKSQSHEINIPKNTEEFSDIPTDLLYGYGADPEEAILESIDSLFKLRDKVIAACNRVIDDGILVNEYCSNKAVYEYYITNYNTGDKTYHKMSEVVDKVNEKIKEKYSK